MARSSVFGKEPQHIRDQITNPDAEPVLFLPPADVEDIRQSTHFLLFIFFGECQDIDRAIIGRQFHSVTKRVGQEVIDSVRPMPRHVVSPDSRLSLRHEHIWQTSGGKPKVASARGIRGSRAFVELFALQRAQDKAHDKNLPAGRQGSCAHCGVRTIYVPGGEAVPLRETFKGVKVWVLDASGQPVPGRMDLPEGWYALPLERQD